MKTQKLWLVAHDLTPLGDAAARSAASLAVAGDRVLLLHVTPVPLREPWDRDGKHTFSVEEERRRLLRITAAELMKLNPGIEVDVEVLAGEPRARILDEARRLDASHVVVGTHDRHGLPRLVLGSVAEDVVHRATVPVLVVKPTGRSSAAA